jgi:phage antirepressor YoqD-like protein
MKMNERQQLEIEIKALQITYDELRYSQGLITFCEVCDHIKKRITELNERLRNYN